MNRMAFLVAFILIMGGSIFCVQNEDTAATGIIKGRVTDAEDKPLVNASVDLIKGSRRYGYDPSKIRTVLTDSMGKYEFTKVQEGDYWIRVQPANPIYENGKPMLFYFPDQLLMKDSYIFRVGPNAVLTAMDVRCIPGKIGFEAKGKVVESMTRKPLTNVRLVYGPNSNLARTKQDVQTDEKGFFVISRLDPGKYWAAILHEQSENYYCYPIYFEIIDSDISDLQITASKGPSLKGTVVLSSNIPATFFSDHVVVFRPKGISEVNQHPTNSRIDSSMQKISPILLDGSFLIKGLPPLVGQLSLQKGPGSPLENQFIVSIEQNGANLNKAFRIEDTDINGVVIHVSAGIGRIKGKIKLVNSAVELKRIAVIISLQNETVSSFIKPIQIDANGEFALDGLIQGEYRVYATIAVEGGVRRTGDVQLVHLQEGETKEVELLVGN